MGQDRAIARQLLTAVLVFGLVACSAGGDTVRGLVISVEGDIDEVTAFDVRSGGETFSFEPAEDGDFDFELVHLRDHLRSGEPVVVGYEREGDRLSATSLTDG